MISHKYKCIFIHIQRTAGTSIENWIVGKDWFIVDGKTKHLLASQAKKIYKNYWNDYFKFSFVRNPWDRVVSCLHLPDQFGITYKNNRLSFSGYKNKYGYPIILEHDTRYSNRDDVISKKHKKNQVYLNIIDEKLDFIGKFENLEKDVDFIKNKLGIVSNFKIDNKIGASTSKFNIIDRSAKLHNLAEVFREKFVYKSSLKQKSKRIKGYRKYFDSHSKNIVYNMFRNEIKQFNYKF